LDASNAEKIVFGSISGRSGILIRIYLKKVNDIAVFRGTPPIAAISNYV
jgi:hypothetical protein